jgi:hypothetical protein
LVESWTITKAAQKARRDPYGGKWSILREEALRWAKFLEAIAALKGKCHEKRRTYLRKMLIEGAEQGGTAVSFLYGRNSGEYTLVTCLASHCHPIW